MSAAQQIQEQASQQPLPYYQRIIQEIIDKKGYKNLKPNWVEASMRLQYGSLNSLDERTFRKEVDLAHGMLLAGGPEEMEELAKSFGL